MQAEEERCFGRHQTADAPQKRDAFTPDETAYIAARDSFYMAAKNSNG